MPSVTIPLPDLQALLDFLKQEGTVLYNDAVRAAGNVLLWLQEHLPAELPEDFNSCSFKCKDEVVKDLEELVKFKPHSVFPNGGNWVSIVTTILSAIVATLQQLGSNKPSA